MAIHLIDRRLTSCFSEIANTLVYDQESLTEFIQEKFSLDAFEEQMKLKKPSFSKDQRQVLVNRLNDRYKQVSNTEITSSQLNSLLDENTFTVTTGHQLQLFTGPLYFVIKILHVIDLCKKLKGKYPSQNFVPVFWMASEDHDYEEIKSFSIFNKKISWETNQSGPVGRMELEDWNTWKEEVRQLFSNHANSELFDLLAKYEGSNLSEAAFSLVHELFADQGLVIVDGDDAELKKALRPVLERELQENFAQKAVLQFNDKLIQRGFHPQAMPREVNFFHLEKGHRERIIQQSAGFHINDRGDFDAQTLMNEFDEHPDRFSPNVILRPLYQEMILPNLCYVGGGGEIAYWLQLKGVFESVQIPYPLIQVRNSMILLDEVSKKKMSSIQWTLMDTFANIEEKKKEYVISQSQDLDFSDLKDIQRKLEENVLALIAKVDASLTEYGKAEMARLGKQLENLEQKLLRAEKSKHDQALKTMEQIKDRLFFGGMQERSLNFFHFCVDGQVKSHLDKLNSAIDALEKDLIVLEW